MATIKDIADEVGISKAAVSRILNHKGSFSQETILKVERTASRLGYASPGMIRESESAHKTIAAVFPTGSSYYGVLASLVEKAAYDYGYSMLLCSSMYDRDSIEDFLREMREKGIAGILFGSISTDPQILVKSGFPIVSAGHALAPSVPYIHSDNRAAGRIAAMHLLGRGVKHPIYISNYPDGLMKDERYQGFCDEMEKAGTIVWPYILENNAVEEKNSPEIITRMALEHPEADGLFCESQSLSIECLRVYENLGRKVPSDIRIIGYGNPYFSRYTIPKLSYVQESTAEIAKTAVSVLDDLIEKGKSEKLDYPIPVSLQNNETT